MNVFILLIAMVTLLAVLKKITLIESTSTKSLKNEVKKNTQLMLWGILLMFCVLLIPYQVWVITGSSNDWDGVYILGAVLIVTVILCFTMYSKYKKKKEVVNYS